MFSQNSALRHRLIKRLNIWLVFTFTSRTPHSTVTPSLVLAQIALFPAPPSLCPAPCRAEAGDSVLSVFEQETSSIAAYGNLTYNITNVWDVTGGLRWSRDEKDAFISHTNSPGNGFAVNALLFPPTQPGDRDRSESKVTWSFNTRYDLTDDVMLFFTSSTGFKSGGFNSRRVPAGSVIEFEEEESLTFETGLKSFFLDRTTMLNLTIFHTTIEDFQASTLAPTGAGFIVGNAGEQEVKGLEADFLYTPNENFTLNGSLAYLDAEYTEFSDAPCGAGEVPDNPNGANNTCNRIGDRRLSRRNGSTPSASSGLNRSTTQISNGLSAQIIHGVRTST